MDALEEAWAKLTAEGRPYMPANGTEGEIFQEDWCAHCTHDAEFRRQWDETGGNPQCDGCEILAASLRGEQPKEWFYHKGQPICSAFTDGPLPTPRCPHTMEMF